MGYFSTSMGTFVIIPQMPTVFEWSPRSTKQKKFYVEFQTLTQKYHLSKKWNIELQR